jgi:hypothetical protein
VKSRRSTKVLDENKKTILWNHGNQKSFQIAFCRSSSTNPPQRKIRQPRNPESAVLGMETIAGLHEWHWIVLHVSTPGNNAVRIVYEMHPPSGALHG